MLYFKITCILSALASGLCILALPLWIMGVPGTENNYAKGWSMGLQVITSYPPTWLVLYIPYFIFRNRVGEAARSQWQTIVSALATIIFLAAFVRLVQAFKVMI